MRDLEAARYAADRAFKQYDTTDPDNRLVAAELEARWNKTLARVEAIENRVAVHNAALPQTLPLSAPDIAMLAANLCTVWSAPATDARLKKRIVRTVIHEVIADLDETAAEIVLLIHWSGGVHTELRLPKRRRGQRNATPDDIVEAVSKFVLIAGDDLIAGILNRNGLTTGNGNRWTRERVTALRSHRRIPGLPAAAGWRRALAQSRSRSAAARGYTEDAAVGRRIRADPWFSSFASYPQAREGDLYNEPHAFPRKIVDHRQNPESSPVAERV
jgi:hypothetical protein